MEAVVKCTSLDGCTGASRLPDQTRDAAPDAENALDSLGLAIIATGSRIRRLGALVQLACAVMAETIQR